MHGSKKKTFANVPEVKQIYQYKNIKEKLYKINEAIEYDNNKII